MELLLVTSRWPLATGHEFLDDEIHHLARAFDRILVAPLRPDGPLAPGLPNAVSVDHSLADHLVGTRFLRSRSSRRMTAALRATIPNPSGFGVTPKDLLKDGRDKQWVRQSLLSRADSASVARWAATRSAPAIAYTFWLGAATVGLRASWPDTPLVSRAHGGDIYPDQHGWASIPYQAAGVQAVDRLASASQNGLDYLTRRYPHLAPKAVVRRLGIRDLGGLADRPDPRRLSILSVSSIDANKRVNLIAKVVMHLAESQAAVDWTHLGIGPGRVQLDRTLAKRPANLKVDLRGHVPIGIVHQELVAGRHAVFINLSLSEGAPVSLMEAQCVGLPVVATAVGGTPEVAPVAWNELVSPTDSVEAVAEAVLRAASRPDQEWEGRRRHWAQFFDAEPNYATWAEELHRLAADGRPTR